ncbi:MAG TPA: TetR/AcrR family transcriptional regulator [Candidatus Cybelea sp.]|nr:TetR/AcrR family transcriptional regulator [Candidatus Cybelea sp.]
MAGSTPRAATARRKKDLTRERILHAAARVFRDRGYAATRLADVARAAGMQAGSLYYHFNSKEHLLSEVLETGIERVSQSVRAAIAAVPADRPWREQLEAAITAHVESLHRHEAFSSATFRNLGRVPKSIRERHMQRRRAYGLVWRDLLRDGRRKGAIRKDIDLTLAEMLLLGALNWSIEWFEPARKTISVLAVQAYLLLGEGMVDRGA